MPVRVVQTTGRPAARPSSPAIGKLSKRLASATTRAPPSSAGSSWWGTRSVSRRASPSRSASRRSQSAYGEPVELLLAAPGEHQLDRGALARQRRAGREQHLRRLAALEPPDREHDRRRRLRTLQPGPRSEVDRVGDHAHGRVPVPRARAQPAVTLERLDEQPRRRGQQVGAAAGEALERVGGADRAPLGQPARARDEPDRRVQMGDQRRPPPERRAQPLGQPVGRLDRVEAPETTRLAGRRGGRAQPVAHRGQARRRRQRQQPAAVQLHAAVLDILGRLAGAAGQHVHLVPERGQRGRDRGDVGADPVRDRRVLGRDQQQPHVSGLRAASRSRPTPARRCRRRRRRAGPPPITPTTRKAATRDHSLSTPWPRSP